MLPRRRACKQCGESHDPHNGKKCTKIQVSINHDLFPFNVSPVQGVSNVVTGANVSTVNNNLLGVSSAVIHDNNLMQQPSSDGVVNPVVFSHIPSSGPTE